MSFDLSLYEELFFWRTLQYVRLDKFGAFSLKIKIKTEAFPSNLFSLTILVLMVISGFATCKIIG